MHNLFGERFIGMRTAGWHQLGIVKPENQQLTAVEAFKEGRLDFKYHALPIGITLPDGTVIPTSKDLAVFREPTPDDPEWRNLGIVNANYRFLQNDKIAQGIDAITEKTGWKFETAGALGKGETVFVCLRAGTYSIKGDEIKSFLLVVDGKAGNRALKVMTTPVRAVCENTVIKAEEDSDLFMRIPHSGNVEEDYAFWMDLIADLKQNEEEAMVDLRAMADAKISDEIARQIFMDAFPEPNKNPNVLMSEALPNRKGVTAETLAKANAKLAKDVEAYDYNLRQSQRWNEAAFELYTRFNEGNEKGGSMSGKTLQALQGTAYAALQAVTELCDWGGTNRESVASATLFGGRATQKTRAWSSALRVAKAALN